MPNRRFDWHEHVQEVEGEYKAARVAVDQLIAQLVEFPDQFPGDRRLRAYLRKADRNLEGTYLVRLFAAFEAALRSYDRARHSDPERTLDAGTLIDSTAGRRGQGISAAIRAGAHAVREARNFWAHESEESPTPLTLAEARARLQKYLSWLPEEWD